MKPLENRCDLLSSHATQIRRLTYWLFFMFAMTSDAVGVIIPQLVVDFNLSYTQASAFHYAPMAAIAISGLGLGFLADRFGRKAILVAGLLMYAAACLLFVGVEHFYGYLALLLMMGCAIGLFKTSALAALGDISRSDHEHTQSMNKVEGFFGVGAMVGPALVAVLLQQQAHWSNLYVVAGGLCIALAIFAWRTPMMANIESSSFAQNRLAQNAQSHINPRPAGLASTLVVLSNRYALGFSLAIALYVATEVSIYVWLPSLLADYQGPWPMLAAMALPLFFGLRALGRFLAQLLLQRWRWQSVLALLSLAITVCFAASLWLGIAIAVLLMPLTGLFMSMIYPTLNSKGISCFPRYQHGAVAGVILFFTALAAALGPLLMAMVSDYFGHIRYGFYLALLFASLLSVMLCVNWWYDSAGKQLSVHNVDKMQHDDSTEHLAVADVSAAVDSRPSMAISNHR